MGWSHCCEWIECETGCGRKKRACEISEALWDCWMCGPCSKDFKRQWNEAQRQQAEGREGEE